MVNIGVVLDGPTGTEDISRLVRSEIVALNRREFDIRFPDEKTLDGNWSAPAAVAALDRLLADPDVDIVLTMGVLATSELARREDPPKPVIAPFVIDQELQGFHPRASRRPDGRTIRVSGIDNLNYLIPPWNTARDLFELRRITGYNRIVLLIDERLVEGLPELQEHVRRAAEEGAYDLRVVPVTGDIDATVASIPADIDAVVVGFMGYLSDAAFANLAAGLIARKLPSYAVFGRPDVERGLMLGAAPESDFERVGRRVAINIQRILLGENASGLSIDLALNSDLTFNMATARAIGFSPSFALLTEATVLFEERLDVAREVSLLQAVREALEVNLDLAAFDRAVAAGMQQVRGVRSGLLPQLDVSLTGVQIDADRAEASFGSQRERTFTAGLGLTQLIWSDELRTQITAQEHSQQALEHQREQLRLDVIAEAAAAFLDILRAKIGENVLKQNLSLTRTNLDLARVRQSIGTANPAEVFRWESQLATERSEVIDASALRNQAEIALNRVLNRPLEEPFRTVDEGIAADPLESDAWAAFRAELEPYLDNQGGFAVLRDFMAQEALRASPELRQLDAFIAAQQRVLTGTRRALWAPTIALSGQLSQILGRGGAGDPSSSAVELPFSFPAPGNNSWSVGLSASLPLMTGGFRVSERQRALHDLEQLSIERRATAERIEQRTRSAMHATRASFAALELTRVAAVAARRNFELVQDAYAQGVADIIDLLDAQNAALVSDLGAATAVYDYLLDLVNVERSVARFNLFASDVEARDFLRRLADFNAQRTESDR